MKRILLILLLTIISLLLSGCLMGYLLKSSYYQMKLLAKKERFERALKDPEISEDTKRKIRLVQDVKKFGEDKLHLRKTGSYESFVTLDDRYVTYVITASYKDRMEPYTWSFPIVGRVPYKGFFVKGDAVQEKDSLEKQNFDVAMRGVSAFSTLGWFADPLLSSMTAYEDADLVDTIIHETTHATLYIKSNAEFNERFATFVGTKGMELFYTEREGTGSKSIERAKLMSEDSKVFSTFITAELKKTDDFYSSHKNSPTLMADREKRFDEIQELFRKDVVPKLKTDSYKYFLNSKLNNAVLMNYKTYFHDLDIFEKAFQKCGNDWKVFLEKMKTLKSSEDPEKDLKQFVNS